MLTPEFLQTVPKAVEVLYSELEMNILESMATRISAMDLYIPAVQYQELILTESAVLKEDIISQLATMTKKTEEAIVDIMKEAVTESLASENAYYQLAGLSVEAGTISPSVQKVIEAGLEKTNGLFTNLTSSLASASNQQFVRVMDTAYLKVTSGAFSYTQTITSAIKDLAGRGVEAVVYPSGKTETVEVAARRAIVTGVNQTCLQVQAARAEELGIDLVETTAHAGARPSHAEWQGQVFSLSGKSDKYKSLKDGTGYGTGAGLGGWNCSHSFHAFVEGFPRAYSDKKLEEYEDPKAVNYNDVDMSQYEANQTQRYIERNIRKWKREAAALSAAGEDSSAAKAKVKEWNGTLSDFSEQTGLSKQPDRTTVATT